MDKIIVSRPVLGVSQRKVKLGYRIELTPRHRFVLANIDKSMIKPVNFDLDKLLVELKRESEEWTSKLQIWYQIKKEKDEDLVVNSNLTLSGYQTTGLKMMFTLDRGFLLMDPGTGKTPVALTAIAFRSDCTSLVACPNNARVEWAIMAKMFFPEMKVKIITSNEKFTPEKGTLYVVGYKRLIRLKDLPLFDQVIFDEVHKLKSHTSSTHKAGYKLSRGAKYVYGLTGTLYGNNLFDVFGSCRVVEEKLYGADKGSFEDTYMMFKTVKKQDGTKYPQFIGYQNIEFFKKQLSYVSYVVRKADVLTLKDPTETILWVEKPPQYDIMERDLMIELENDNYSIVQRQLNLTFKLQQICSGFTNTEQGWVRLNTNKLEAFTEYIEDLEDQLVIFLTYDMSEIMITEELKKRKITYDTVSRFSKNPEKAKQDFKDKKIQIIIIKYQSGTEGMNFQNCNKMMFYDLTPSYIDYTQARDRIHRRGQERECEYIHMITEDSREIKMLKALRKHQDFAEYLTEEEE